MIYLIKVDTLQSDACASERVRVITMQRKAPALLRTAGRWLKQRARRHPLGLGTKLVSLSYTGCYRIICPVSFCCSFFIRIFHLLQTFSLLVFSSWVFVGCKDLQIVLVMLKKLKIFKTKLWFIKWVNAVQWHIYKSKSMLKYSLNFARSSLGGCARQLIYQVHEFYLLIPI